MPDAAMVNSKSEIEDPLRVITECSRTVPPGVCKGVRGRRIDGRQSVPQIGAVQHQEALPTTTVSDKSLVDVLCVSGYIGPKRVDLGA